VPAKESLPVKDSNGITTEEQLTLWSAANTSDDQFSHLLDKSSSSPTFALWFEAIQTSSTLIEASTTEFLPKDHHI